jgi:hypothetical protein
MLRPLSTREKTAEQVQEHPAVQKKVKQSYSVDVVLHPRRDTQLASGSGLLSTPTLNTQHSTLRTILEGLADMVMAPVPLE